MTKKIFALALCFSITALLSCEGQKGKSSVSLKTTADSVSYSIGVSIGLNMKKDGLDSLDLSVMKDGIQSAINGDSLLVDQATAQSVIQAYVSAKQKRKSDATLAEGKKYLADNKSKTGVIELKDGLQYQVVKEGSGPKPTLADTVIVHYHGTFIDGTVFDSSVERGQPYETTLNMVIKGWTEALQLMNVGEKIKLVVPPDLAYGERGSMPRIPGNSVLVFDLELLKIKGK